MKIYDTICCPSHRRWNMITFFLFSFGQFVLFFCILEQANRLAHDPNFPSVRINIIGYSEIIVIYRSIWSIGKTSTIFCRWIEFISFDSFLQKFKTDLSCTLVIIFRSSFVVLFLVIPTKLQLAKKKDESSKSQICAHFSTLFDYVFVLIFFRYDEILDWIIKCILVVYPAVLLSHGAMQGTNIQSKCKFTTPRIPYLYLNISFGVANWNVVI